tara:strand:+ start:367 stop:582 length:216 start_codon:yes stop_codon:yes gene_type:complete
MKAMKPVPVEIFMNQLKVNRKNQSKIDWQETFIEYIKENNIDLYDKAIKYTNNLEANDYFTEEEKQKWGMK